jgi:HTH-type transcriptional regulator/antitoxin MqsA
VKAIRERLKLSQRQAGLILGGGPRSFQKCESGEVEPSEPMLNLLTVLDREPRLLKVLTAARAAHVGLAVEPPMSALARRVRQNT